MKVRDIMSQNVQSVGSDDHLATAATLMWEADCGVVPVVGENNKVLGMLTDRDICIAVATRHRRADEIRVGEVISGQLFSCDPDAELKTALVTMKEHKIRRVPVVGRKGELLGVLSLNDVILEAKEGRNKKSPSVEEVLDVLKAISGHRWVAVAA